MRCFVVSQCNQRLTVAELLITSYFAVVKREMIDMVPKAITLTLVNHAKENLQRELLEHLYKPDVLEELLKESPDVVARYAPSHHASCLAAEMVTDGSQTTRMCQDGRCAQLGRGYRRCCLDSRVQDE